MKSIILISIGIFFQVAITGCNIICTDGEGPVISEKRSPGEFKEVDLSIPADLVITKGQQCEVLIEAEENILKEISLQMNGDEIEIETSGCINPHKRIKISVTLPELSGLEVNGSGNISIPDTLQVERMRMEINGSGKINAKLIAADLTAEINGSGDINLNGSANKMETEINGSGNINASLMPCNTLSVQVNGSGDVKSYVIKDLEVRVNGSGSVYYKGKPAVSTKIFGSGKVVDEN